MRSVAAVLALFLGLDLHGCAADPPASREHVDTAVPVDRPMARPAADILPGMMIERDYPALQGRRLRADGEVLPILTAEMNGPVAQLADGLNEANWVAASARPGRTGTTTISVHSSRYGDAPL